MLNPSTHAARVESRPKAIPSWPGFHRMFTCYVNCHANFKDHALLCRTGSESLVALHVYILPQHGPAVNITLPHALAKKATPRGKHVQKSARERGLDFGGRLIIVGRCGNHFTTPLQLRPPLGEVPMLQNVNQPAPLSGPPQEAGSSRVRTSSLSTLHLYSQLVRWRPSSHGEWYGGDKHSHKFLC